MLENNRIVNENIDNLIEDYTRQNFNPIGLFLNGHSIIFKLRYWNHGSPVKINRFILYQKNIRASEAKYIGAAVGYLKNLRHQCSDFDSGYLKKQEEQLPNIEDSVNKFLSLYGPNEKINQDIEIHQRDFINIILRISDIMLLWKRRNKSRIREIGEVFNHFSLSYSKEMMEDIFIPNKNIDAVRAVIDPEKYISDLEMIDLSNRDIRPYIVRSPVYKNDFERHFNSEEEKRVSDLVFNLDDNYPYNGKTVWNLCCNRGRRDNVPLTMTNMFSK